MIAVTKGTNLLTDEPPPSMSTGAAPEAALASDLTRSDVHRMQWQQVIDEKLVEWGRYPAQLAEPDLIPPTDSAIRSAVRIAMDMRDASPSHPPPLRVVPDGDGGVVFERWEGSSSESIEIHGDGGAEYVQIRNHRVIQRTAWPTE